MRLRPKGVVERTGLMMLVYGATGVGKTASCFATLPGKILVISNERRNMELAALSVGRPEDDWDIVEDFTLTELIDFLLNPAEFLKTNFKLDFGEYQSIMFDGLTQASENVEIELQNEAFDSRVKKAEKSKDEDFVIDKPLISQTKMAEEGYGALAGHLGRMTNLLGGFSQEGKVVVFTSLMTSHPKWDETNTLEAAPALIGRKFPTNLPGKMDLIGYVVDNIKFIEKDADEKDVYGKVYPPLVKFECGVDEWGTPEHFQCKWTGPRPTVKKTGLPVKTITCPLDFNIILGLIKKRKEAATVSKSSGSSGSSKKQVNGLSV